MDDPLVDWMVKLDASKAAKELATFAGTAEDTLDKLDDHAKSLKFTNTMGWATQASPALGQVLTELASVRKNVFGVDVAFRQAQQTAAGFTDLEEELRVINQLFKDSQISADIAQKAFAKVGRAGGDRRDEGAALADANARAEEAHWAKIDREREESAKRLAKIAEDNVAREENHWAQVDRERERSAMDLARKQADADVVRRTRIRESITELKTLAGLGVGAGIAAIGMSARSGFQDTLQGQQASAYGQLLNRQVASIFAPLLEEKTKYVAQMTTWLQGLSDPQRKSIQQMTVFGTAMGAAALIVPRVTKALATLAMEGALGGTLARMTAKGGALGGVAANAGLIGLSIGGVAAILASSEKGRESLANLAKAFEPLIPAFASLIDQLTPALTSVVNSTTRLIGWLDRQFPQSAGPNALAGPMQGAFESGAATRRWLLSLFGFESGAPTVLFGGNQPNAPAGGQSLSGVPKGFEDFEAAYTRINEAATKIDLQGQQLAAQQQANTFLAQIVANTAGEGAIVQGSTNAMLNAIGF